MSVRPCVQQEHWFEKALCEKKGFVIKKMKEDGACLFRAVGEFLTHTHTHRFRFLNGEMEISER